MNTARGDRMHIFTSVKPLKTFYILPQWRELFQGFYTLKIEWWYSWGAMVVYSCSGESTPLPPMWPGCNSQVWCHMWVEFVVGSLPCSKRFSLGTPVLPSPQKPTFPNSNLTRNQVDEEPLCGCATSKSLFILFVFFYILRFTRSQSTMSNE